MLSFAKNDKFSVILYDLDSLMQMDERQLKLLLILAAKADPLKDYTCCPTQEELTQLSGWSRPTVQTIINSLLDLRIEGKQIVTSQKVSKQGGGYYTVYSVNCFK